MTAVGIQNVVQDIHMVQHGTGTLGHTVQRVLSHMDIDAGLALNELVKARSSAPPPVRVMPWSMMSALSSGGVRSRVSLMALVILTRHSSRASRTSSEWTTTFLGRPSTSCGP